MLKRELRDITNQNEIPVNLEPKVITRSKSNYTTNCTNSKLKCTKRKNTEKSIKQIEEFAHEIYLYLIAREYEFNLKKFIINKQCLDIRKKLILCLFKLANKIVLSNDAIYLSIALLDLYLPFINSDENDDNYLICIVILILSSKIEDCDALSLEDVTKIINIDFTDDLRYCCKEIESHLLLNLDFNVNSPTPIQFLRHYIKLMKTSNVTYQTSKMFVDFMLIDDNFCYERYSLIAAVAYCLAADLNSNSKLGSNWIKSLTAYTNVQLNDIMPIMRKLVKKLIEKSHEFISYSQIISKRYSDSVVLNIMSNDFQTNLLLL